MTPEQLKRANELASASKALTEQIEVWENAVQFDRVEVRGATGQRNLVLLLPLDFEAIKKAVLKTLYETRLNYEVELENI